MSQEETDREPSRFAARPNATTPVGSALVVLLRNWPLRTGTVRGPVAGALPSFGHSGFFRHSACAHRTGSSRHSSERRRKSKKRRVIRHSRFPMLWAPSSTRESPLPLFASVQIRSFRVFRVSRVPSWLAPGSVGGYPPTPPQTRTSRFPAYGSLSHGFAAYTECTTRAFGR